MRTLVTSALIMTLSTAPHIAAAQTGNAPFCLKTMNGQLNCTFPTMTQCEQARPDPSSEQCMTRSDAGGTTGLGDRPAALPRPPSEQLPATDRSSTDR